MGYGTRMHKDRWLSGSADDCISAAIQCGVLVHHLPSIGRNMAAAMTFVIYRASRTQLGYGCRRWSATR